MSAPELADRLESMALVAALPVQCPYECCERHSTIRAHTWPLPCRDELRAAAKLLRGMR